jgi:hypothetical protein
VVDFLRGFSRIAILPGEDNEPLVYEHSEQVCNKLERFYLSAMNDEQQFMDVYAKR